MLNGAEHPIYAKILATIRNLQLDILAQAPCKYDQALVTEFYIMMHEKEPFSGEMYVRGRVLQLSAESIREFLGAREPVDGEGIYEHTGLNAINIRYGDHLVANVVQEDIPTDSFVGKNMILRQYLTTEVRLWQQWVQYNVLPSSHLPDLYPPIARMIRALMENVYVDIGAIIVGEVMARPGKPLLLAFSCLITAFCKHHRVGGIQCIGPPKGPFTMKEARQVFEAGESARIRVQNLVEDLSGAHMPEDDDEEYNPVEEDKDLEEDEAPPSTLPHQYESTGDYSA